MMKLQNELSTMVDKFDQLKEQIKIYAPKLYASKDYKDFVTRLSYDCFHAAYRGEERCSYYDHLQEAYPGFTDQHLKTLLRTALLTVYPDAEHMEQAG